MAMNSAHWTITRSTGNIRYTGPDHGVDAAASYATVIELHRWLQDFADQAEFSGDDELDIVDNTPSDRSTDNIITLINGFNIDDAASEHLFDGSIIQGTGGSEVIYDGIVNFGNVGVRIGINQNAAMIADDWWNYNVGGTDDTSTDAAFLTDSGASFTTDEFVGFIIKNVTDGSEGIITANTGTTVTAILGGGAEDDWDNGDVYLISQGLNSNAAGGISSRFMIKVRDTGADIDARRLLGQCRTFNRTYAEFNIPATARGNNVFALNDSGDLNNTTVEATVAGWTAITNTEGFRQIDVDNNGSPEDYYSEWNRDVFTINQFTERMKWLTRTGQSTTLYGIVGEVFRGITHEFDIDAPSGTFTAVESVTWAGGTGQMYAIDSVTAGTKMWIQHLTGVLPSDDDVITAPGSGATAVAEFTTGSLTPRTVSTPVFGVSTGSAIIGAYGFGIEAADLVAADLVFDLTNTAIFPPNNVIFEVLALVSGEDYLLVGTNDAGDFDFNQYTLNGVHSSVTQTTITVNEAIESETPSTGTIRVTRADGLISRHPYSDATGFVFTITSADFSGNNGAANANVFNSYLDLLATSSSETFTYVYSGDRTLFIRVRDGGTAGDAEGIKTFETTGIMGAGGGSSTVIRTSDV